MKLNKMVTFFVVLVLFLGMVTASLYAQVGRGKERIRGKVVDKDGKPIASAAVTIQFRGHYRQDMKTRRVEFEPASASGMDIKFETKTDAAGRFRFIGLGFGQWELTATYGDLEPGYEIVVLQSGLKNRLLTLTLEEKSPNTGVSTSTSTSTSDDLSDQLDEETKKILKSPKKLFQLGEQFLQSNELEYAIRCFHLASKRKPKWSAPYLKMGYSYFNLGETKQALENFKKFLELDPDSPEALTVKEMVEILKEE